MGIQDAKKARLVGINHLHDLLRLGVVGRSFQTFVTVQNPKSTHSNADFEILTRVLSHNAAARPKRKSF